MDMRRVSCVIPYCHMIEIAEDFGSIDPCTETDSLTDEEESPLRNGLYQ